MVVNKTAMEKRLPLFLAIFSTSASVEASVEAFEVVVPNTCVGENSI